MSGQKQHSSIVQALLQTWPARLAQTAIEAAKLPGDVYSGQTPIAGPDGRTNPEVINRAADLAGMVTGGSYASPAMEDAAGMGIRAYHGSPYDFNAFDASKIGTGEGARAYGHGLYFAENPQTAQAYRSMLAPSTDYQRAAASAVKDYGSPEAALAEMQARLGRMSGRGDPGNIQFLQGMIGELQKGGKLPGHTYEVNINADPQHMLPWDEQLQPDMLQALRPLVDPSKVSAFDHFGRVGVSGETAYKDFLGGGLYRTRPQASANLNDAGIPGIRYLDQGSRGLDAGNGTSNYVVFNPQIVDILKKYGIAGMAGTSAVTDALLGRQPAQSQ